MKGSQLTRRAALAAVAGLVLAHCGSDEQRERWLRPLAGGEKRGTPALWDAGTPANPGEFVEARTEIVRRTRSVVFVRGRLGVGGRQVLAASGIWKVLDSSARTTEGGMA